MYLAKILIEIMWSFYVITLQIFEDILIIFISPQMKLASLIQKCNLLTMISLTLRSWKVENASVSHIKNSNLLPWGFIERK
jgi:hypothetical protein